MSGAASATDGARADAAVLTPKQPQLSSPYDWVVDCIDSLQPKVELLRAALKHRVRVVSTMGAGGRLDAEQVFVTDLSELRWERKAAQGAKGRDKDAMRTGGRAARLEGPVAHDKLGTFVRKKLRKEYGIEGGTRSLAFHFCRSCRI